MVYLDDTSKRCPLQLLVGARCICQPIFRIESVYIGDNMIRTQVKLLEVRVRLLGKDSGVKTIEYKAANLDKMLEMFKPTEDKNL